MILLKHSLGSITQVLDHSHRVDPHGDELRHPKSFLGSGELPMRITDFLAVLGNRHPGFPVFPAPGHQGIVCRPLLVSPLEDTQADEKKAHKTHNKDRAYDP